MAVTATSNARTLCTAALQLAGVSPVGEAPDATEMALAVAQLNWMLKAIEPEDALWLRASQTVALAADTASFALSGPARPVRVLSARYIDANSIALPMERMTREEYDALPIKTTKGIPTTFMVERAREQMTIYVWPVLAARTTETLNLTVIREIEDVTSADDTLDLPAEWYDAILYGLADRLCDFFGVADTRRAVIAGRAAEKMRDARAQAMPESVFMGFGDG